MADRKQTLGYTRAEVQALLEKIDHLNTVEGKVHIYDIGSANLDLAALDFSQYVPGSVILVVADMDGGA